MAVLTPVAIAAAIAAGRGARRKLIVGVLIASIVPMVISLNRGMFLSLGIGVLYVALRLALRGRLAALGSLLGVAALVALIFVVTPLGHLIAASFASIHGHSNATRLSASQLAHSGRPAVSDLRPRRAHAGRRAKASSQPSAPRASCGWCCTRTAFRQ